MSLTRAVRWVAASNRTGIIDLKLQGGDTRSHHIEAFCSVILAAIEAQKDVSLVELADLLLTRHGASFAASTVRRFLHLHAMTFKRNSARCRAGTARRCSKTQCLVRGPIRS